MKASRPPVPVAETQKKHRVKPLVAILVAVAILLGVAAVVVAVNFDTWKQSILDRKTVATCNGYDIPYKELKILTNSYKYQLALEHGKDIWDDPAVAETYREELERLVKENLNQKYIALSAAKQAGLDVSTSSSAVNDYVNRQVEALKSQCGSEQVYQAYLASEGRTEDLLKLSLRIGYVVSAIHQSFLENDTYEFRYEDNAEAFVQHVLTSGEYVRTLHVRIDNEQGEDSATNLAAAQKISDNLQAAKTVNERMSLLSEYIGSSVNDDTGDFTGDGYYFMRGEMEESYENASFDLEIGEASEPVLCGDSNYVIMRFELEEAYVRNNVVKLMNAYYSVEIEEYIEKFRPLCDVSFTEYGKTIDILTIE